MAIVTKKTGELEYLTAEGIQAPHGFTTRLGGVSTGEWASMNLQYHRGDAPDHVDENYRILARAIGFFVKNLVMTRQTHSDRVRVVDRSCHAGLDHHQYPECDALVTRDPGTALVVFTADCTPILLYDPITGAVGAAHAGWRGTASAIAAKTVETMCREFGSKPWDIRAAIGPNIGPCCFETGEDVPKAMRQTFGEEAERWVRAQNEKYYVNLKELNALALRRAGVRQIEISEACTMCHPNRFWSHRVTQGHRGTQGGIIVCKGGTL